jgi:galactose-1-phosphate uridylyltransferase
VVHPLTRLPDGTVRQVGPLTGTSVWTIPGRAHRPITHAPASAHPLVGDDGDHLCSFCPQRYLETTPEKSRLIGSGADARVERGRLPSQLRDGVATARRFANLFEIVSTRSWRVNHGFRPKRQLIDWAEAYLADPLGPEHVVAISAFRHRMGGPPAPAADDHGGLLSATVDLLAGSHDVIVPRRHVVDGATSSDQLVASGALTPGEHADLIAYTVESLADLYRAQPAAAYVAVFQNWLPPAGASLEHLHKQLVAIDAYGPQMEREAGLLVADPQLYQHGVLDLAVAEGLVVAATDHAVAVAGVGHRFPSLEIYSTSPRQLPWEQTPAELRSLSDLLHAVHAATGPAVPTNEEWHHRPPGLPAPMPWRIVLKWRISLPAGFEGGTKIYVNTIDPWTLRDRVVAQLAELRRARRIAPLRIGAEVLAGEVQLPPLR